MKDIKIKKIKPMGNVIVTTYDRYQEDAIGSSGLITGTNKVSGAVKSYQKVVSVGPMVRDVKPGDMVMLTFDRYYAPDYSDEGQKLSGVVHMKNSPKYLLNTITLADGEYLLVTSQDIMYIIEDYEL